MCGDTPEGNSSVSPRQRGGSREEWVSSVSLHSTEQGLWAASTAEAHPGATLTTALTLEQGSKYKIRNTEDKSRVSFIGTHFLHALNSPTKQQVKKFWQQQAKRALIFFSMFYLLLEVIWIYNDSTESSDL